MTPLTMIGIAALLLMIKKIVDIYINAEQPAAQHKPMVTLILQLGIFSFFLGILAQAISLIEAFQAIEQIGSVSPAMLAGGLKVSMICPVYGLLIFLVAFTGWTVLKYRLESMLASE